MEIDPPLSLGLCFLIVSAIGTEKRISLADKECQQAEISLKVKTVAFCRTLPD